MCGRGGDRGQMGGGTHSLIKRFAFTHKYDIAFDKVRIESLEGGQ